MRAHFVLATLGLIMFVVPVGCRRSEREPPRSRETASPLPAHVSEVRDHIAPVDVPVLKSSSAESNSTIPASTASSAAAILAPAANHDAEKSDSASGFSSQATSTSAEESTTWSRQRLVILAPDGPRRIDVRCNVDGVDLTRGLAMSVDRIAEELQVEWNETSTWDRLLEQPLFTSGWLGNLVPTTEQRSQFLSIYDVDKNGLVGRDELSACLTRGLARRDAMRFSSTTPTQPDPYSSSPWGLLDQNGDGELSKEEMSRTEESLYRLDFDNDRILSQGEVVGQSSRENIDAMSRGRDLLTTPASAILVDVGNDSTAIKPIFTHYTFTELIPRQRLASWSDELLGRVDASGDRQISAFELKRYIQQDGEADLGATFPNSSREQLWPVKLDVTQSERLGDYTNTRSGGRLEWYDCVIVVRLVDDYSAMQRQFAMKRFEAALNDEMTRTAITSSLTLQDGAFEILRGQREEKSSTAWRWTVAPRHWHITITCSSVSNPWFHLLDRNDDLRLVASEVQQLPQLFKRWDRDEDGILEINEAPIVLELSIHRDDTRRDFFSAGGTAPENSGINALPAPDWYQAMDYNSDGEITPSEFLGEQLIFSQLDSDGSGRIEVSEVYTAP